MREIIKHRKELRMASSSHCHTTDNIITNQNYESKEIWGNKYKPHKFQDLLTDELTNRNILTWLTSWRKHEVGVKPGTRFATGTYGQKKGKNFFKQKPKGDRIVAHEYRYPQQVAPEDLDYEDKRILIMGGGPGIGKS